MRCWWGWGGCDHDCPQSRSVAGTVTVLSQLLAPGADSWISPGGHQLDTVCHCNHTIAVLTISFVVLKSKTFEIGWGFTSVFLVLVSATPVLCSYNNYLVPLVFKTRGLLLLKGFACLSTKMVLFIYIYVYGSSFINIYNVHLSWFDKITIIMSRRGILKI